MHDLIKNFTVELLELKILKTFQEQKWHDFDYDYVDQQLTDGTWTAIWTDSFKNFSCLSLRCNFCLIKWICFFSVSVRTEHLYGKSKWNVAREGETKCSYWFSSFFLCISFDFRFVSILFWYAHMFAFMYK